MKIDGGLSFRMADAGASAREAEEAGYSGAFTAETAHDPFLPCALAAEHTERLEIGTAIAVAFARSPMTVANTAWDLQAYSQGRFVLGLGSQIRPHITKRFSMEWSKPAARMREFVQALNAIWDTWQTGERLDFRGDFYQHTLMTPMFSPPAHEFGKPKVFIAAVGEMMTGVAGEVCDGWFSHGFTTASYLEHVSLPALQVGIDKAGRAKEDVQVSLPGFVVTGETEEEMEAASFAVRKQIAFYGSTPAYKTVLDHHGWGDAQGELNAMSKRGEWDAMAEVIDADMLNEFAVVAEPGEVAPKLKDRYSHLVDRFSFYAPYSANKELWGGVIADLQS
ncbi:MAG: LLM class F420-dependent oxidoreductase [Actinomycetota bacterium]